jgi:hypothetical protein
MGPTQKLAWYNLAVVGLTLAVGAALIPILGPTRAQGAFGCLGLQVFGMLFFRRQQGRTNVDERDAVITQRSYIVAYSVFWAAFVAATMGALFIYGENGAVPVRIVASSVWFAWMLVTGVSSLCVLIQYGRESQHAG